jgi:hypothetical protein
MKPDQERVRTLLTETVALLCKNGLHYRAELRIQGLLGVTVDGDDVFIVHIDECFNGANISLRTSNTVSGSSVPTSLPVEKAVVASEFSASRPPGMAVSYGIAHRQRRKQSSPRREMRSTVCLDEFEEQESSVLKNSSTGFMITSNDAVPSVDNGSVIQSIDNLVKVEKPDHVSHGTEAVQAVTVAVKQENAEASERDIIFVDSKDDSSDNSADMHKLQVQAEEMAKNWLSEMTGRVTGYSGATVGFGQRLTVPGNVQAADLPAQFGTRSRFKDGTVSEAMTDFRVLEDTTAGCSSWQLPANIDPQLVQNTIPTSQNNIREVNALIFLSFLIEHSA